MSSGAKNYRTIDVICSACLAKLYKYRKSGNGYLVKCIPDRILVDYTQGASESGTREFGASAVATQAVHRKSRPRKRRQVTTRKSWLAATLGLREPREANKKARSS